MAEKGRESLFKVEIDLQLFRPENLHHLVNSHTHQCHTNKEVRYRMNKIQKKHRHTRHGKRKHFNNSLHTFKFLQARDAPVIILFCDDSLNHLLQRYEKNRRQTNKTPPIFI